MRVRVHLSAGAYGGQRKASDLQELELQAVWAEHLGYGELKPGPLGKNCALSFPVMSVTPAYLFLQRRPCKSRSISIVQGVEVSPSLEIKKIKFSPPYVFSWIATELHLLSKAGTDSQGISGAIARSHMVCEDKENKSHSYPHMSPRAGARHSLEVG